MEFKKNIQGVAINVDWFIYLLLLV